MTGSTASLTLEASRSLAQIAKDALDEEQYDMVVDSLDQLATLGFHPPPDLIRALFAIVLCDPSDIGGSVGGPVKRKRARQYQGLRYLDRTGPDSATIADAITLLEKISSAAGPDIILDALPPKCVRLDSDEQRLRSTYLQTANGARRASTSPAASRRRKAKRAQSDNDSDGNNGEDDDSQDSDSEDEDSGEFARRIGHMAQSPHIWDVLAYDPNHVEEKPRKKTISHREIDEDDEEAQDVGKRLGNANRDATWRAMGILVQLWERQSRSTTAVQLLNLARQVCPDRANDKSRTVKRRKRDESPGPSAELAKALDLVRIGLTTPTVSEGSKREWETIQRQRAMQSRIEGAACLLGQLYWLAEKEAFIPSTLVKGSAKAVFVHLDCIRMQKVVPAIISSISDAWNFTLTALLYLCESGLEDDEDYDESVPDDYVRCCKRAAKDHSIPATTRRLIEDISDAGWLVAGHDFGQLDHEDLIASVPAEIKIRATDVFKMHEWQLSSQTKNPAVASVSARSGKSKGRKARNEAEEATQHIQALSLALQIKADEIDMMCSRTFVRIEIIKLLLVTPNKESPAPSAAAFAKCCIDAVERVLRWDKKVVERCVHIMARETSRADESLDDFVRGEKEREGSPDAYASDDSSGETPQDVETFVARCRNVIDHVSGALQVLTSCESEANSLIAHCRSVHQADSAASQSPEQKAQQLSSPSKMPRVAFEAATSPPEGGPSQHNDMSLPNLSQSSAKSVETIVLSSDTDDDDIVRVRKSRRRR